MTNDKNTPVCGIVMPISSIDGLAESHWAEVLSILGDAVTAAGFSANLVSNADDVGIIHKRIIQNLYDNPIVVCDVSGRNPNVMFELGLRLAFDKPTIVVKDDRTSYSFDTAAIEHLEYPRDLRFTKIVEFKNTLTAKIRATYERAQSDPNYTTFLKHFGEFTVAKIDKKEVSGQEYILQELKSVQEALHRLEVSQVRTERPEEPTIRARRLKTVLDGDARYIEMSVVGTQEAVDNLVSYVIKHRGGKANFSVNGDNSFKLVFNLDKPTSANGIQRVADLFNLNVSAIEDLPF
jgi:hypothetical protein